MHMNDYEGFTTKFRNENFEAELVYAADKILPFFIDLENGMKSTLAQGVTYQQLVDKYKSFGIVSHSKINALLDELFYKAKSYFEGV